MNNNDMALEVFLASAATYAPELSQNLLVSIYESQKKHQFEEGSDRGASLREMEKLVEDCLNSNTQAKI